MSKTYVTRVSLPSRGKYGGSSVKVARPRIRHLQDYLSFSGNSVIARNQLVAELCDTDLSEHPIGDRDYVFVTIRNMVSAPVIAGQLTCRGEECGEEVPYRLDTRQAKVHELSGQFQRDYELKFPVSGEKRVVNLMTVSREELLEEFVEYYEDTEEELDLKFLGEDLYTFAKYACMLDGSDSFEGIEKNVKYLLELDATDYYVLEMYDLTYPCGPELIARCQCKKCNKEYRVRVKMDSTFFGLSWEGMLRKHRFLSRHSSNSFDDFLSYTIQDLDRNYEVEKDRVEEEIRQKKANAQKRKSRR